MYMNFLWCHGFKIEINPRLFSIIKQTKYDLLYLYNGSYTIRHDRRSYSFYSLKMIRLQIDYLSKQLRLLKAILKTCQHICSCYTLNKSIISCIYKFNKQVEELFILTKNDLSRGYNISYKDTLSGIVSSSFKEYISDFE